MRDLSRSEQMMYEKYKEVSTKYHYKSRKIKELETKIEQRSSSRRPSQGPRDTGKGGQGKRGSNGELMSGDESEDLI